MLLALATPLAAMFACDVRSRLVRAGTLATLALFAGSLAASGARGPMLAAFLGTVLFLVTRPGTWRPKLVLTAVTAAVFAGCVAISQIPDAKSAPPGTAASSPAYSERRTLFTSSGRIGAWRGAIRQAEERPVAGYGFGTEESVFVNRYAGFVADLPENSYIGAALQLGLAGLLLLLAAAGCAFALFARGLTRLGSGRPVAAACAGAVAAALTVAVTQSFLFSVGNVADATAWICLFLLAGTSGVARAAGAQADREAPASSARIASSETRTSHSG
jgi:O-antigen ligase